MFWERFYDLCIKKNTKPNPVAKEIGISSGVISKWKNEGGLPNGETLIKLADHLGCSVDYLLGRTDQPALPLDAQKPEMSKQLGRIIAIYNNSNEEGQEAIYTNAIGVEANARYKKGDMANEISEEIG